MLRALLLGVLASWSSLCWGAKVADLFIVIDDVGNSRTLGQRTVDLPGPLNLAFLPFTPHARSLAQAAFLRGHDILLHAPMANEHGNALGPGALTANMDQAALQSTLRQSLAAIPHVQGVNNHMGSLLTQRAEAMEWVMQVVQDQQLYFIDSLTSAQSVAAQTARAQGIPTLKRDVFLDNELHTQALDQQFKQAIRIAKRRGYAVLIGHPYKETLDYLAKALPRLNEQGVRLRSLSDVLQRNPWQDFLEPKLPSRYWLRSQLDDYDAVVPSSATPNKVLKVGGVDGLPNDEALHTK